MADTRSDAVPTQKQSNLWRWIAGIGLLFAVAIASVSIIVARAEPILLAAVIETLSARFKSRVELDGFHVSLAKGLLVSGNGLRIFGETDPNNHEPGVQPIIGVDEFNFRMSILNFLHRPVLVDTAYVKGLQLNIPPREQRVQEQNMNPAHGKITIVVNKFVCEDSLLIVNTLRPGKLPLEFDIAHLTLMNIGPGAPMHFEAKITNPKPKGIVDSSGSFGPWLPDTPRDTAISGSYAFNHADLSTIKGIGGILSSAGKYAGTMDKIVVDGSTDTPDFRLTVSGRPVPLHTDFHATVDGTTGDTYLAPVKAKLLNTWLLANGSVVKTKPKGHHIELDVAVEKGRIDDLLKLAIKTDPPIMTGAVRLHTKMDLLPGDMDIANRLGLSGNFTVTDARFSNDNIQQKIDDVSMRSLGSPRLAKPGAAYTVEAQLSGTFHLENGLFNFSKIDFIVPGTHVDLAGTYGLDGEQFDFHGTARLDAKLSHMVTGWKSILLKPADPFFSKHGAGTEIPVKITGTKSEPHFGADFGRHEGAKK